MSHYIILILINILISTSTFSTEINPEQWYQIDDFPMKKNSTEFILTGRKYQIASYTYLPLNAEKASVTTVHGYLVNCAYLAPIHRFLLESGYKVTCIEMAGLGQSEGERAKIASFKTYQEFISQLPKAAPDSKFLITHSTGAVGVFDSLFSKKKLPYKHIILTTPLVRIRKYQFTKIIYYLGRYFIDGVTRDPKSADYKSEKLNELHRKDPFWISETPVSWVGNLIEWNNELEKNEMTAPQSNITIIYGGSDQVVDTEYNKNFLEKRIPNASHILLEGGSHYPFWDPDLQKKFKQIVLSKLQL
ncbi:MAG: hypothetical protein CME65_05455 [Halobacteriovoraceae bacterium]|nr:hypothetical protein [Halobacteriovoraceae bacterium]|tara:strand:- start:5218 stop:6129 length:912 start_codon:yes stop_codon:yes gene_type:complete